MRAAFIFLSPFDVPTNPKRHFVLGRRGEMIQILDRRLADYGFHAQPPSGGVYARRAHARLPFHNALKCRSIDFAISLCPSVPDLTFALSPPLASDSELPGRPPLQCGLAAQRLDIGAEDISRRDAIEIAVVMMTDRVSEVVDPRVLHCRANGAQPLQGPAPVRAGLVAEHIGLVVAAK